MFEKEAEEYAEGTITEKELEVLNGESVVEFCPTCEHWKKDCIIYGKKAMAKAGNWERN